jgi:hypothetical protein
VISKKGEKGRERERERERETERISNIVAPQEEFIDIMFYCKNLHFQRQLS